VKKNQISSGSFFFFPSLFSLFASFAFSYFFLYLSLFLLPIFSLLFVFSVFCLQLSLPYLLLYFLSSLPFPSYPLPLPL